MSNERVNCGRCDGSGKIKAAKLLMSQAAIQRLPELAKLLPHEPVPIAEYDVVCPACRGTGKEL